MRRMFNILLISILFTGYAVSQENAFDKINFKNNKIKIQSVYEHDYVKGNPANSGKKIQDNYFDVDGNKIQEINYRFNGTIHSVITFKYDSKGNKIEYIKYEGNKEKMSYRQFFQYDNNGKIVAESGFNGVENYKTVFKYNESKKMTEVVYYLENKVDEKRVFAYTKSVSEAKIMDASMQLLYKVGYTYDTKGNVASEIKTENSGIVTKKVLNTYDANGNLLTEEKYLNGKFATKTIKSYDVHGRLLEVYSETVPGQKFLIQKYIFDTKGLLAEEMYRNNALKDFSKNIYLYHDDGVCKSMDSYYASYKEQVMYVYNYEKY